jgi:tRNA pseudouridine32 synthase/23S rRNA pseudouridine746 synthase
MLQSLWSFLWTWLLLPLSASAFHIISDIKGWRPYRTRDVGFRRLGSTSAQADNDDGAITSALLPHKKIQIRILLETDQVIVIDKPSGIPHHDDDGSLGILNLFRQQQQQDNATAACRLYGIHRLDRVTSGILVLGKSRKVAQRLGLAFRQQRVIKYYVGLSQHKKTKKQGSVVGGMERSRRKSWKLTRHYTSSNYVHTKYYSSGLGHLMEDDYNHHQVKTLLLLQPLTGRTHQLRVAAKSVGLPLAGDPTYSSSSNNNLDGDNTFDRTYLHAMGLYIPADGVLEEIAVVSLPYDDGCFDRLWTTTQGQEGFHESLRKLMIQHCGCPEILDLLLAATIDDR